MSYLLSMQLLGEAVDAVTPVFKEYFRKEMIKRDELWVVVVNPVLPYGSVSSFEQAIMFEKGIGYPDPKYREVARSKAKISWRTGLPSHVVQQQAPYLLTDGDTKWGGSTVTPEGLIVACSGVEWYMDQLMAEMIAATIKALSIGEMLKIMEDKSITFL